MVEDRITDGTRIGQLLASELTGLGGVLEDVSVVEADPEVEPTDAGAFAFEIEYRNESVGAVYVTPETAQLRLNREPATVPERNDVTVETIGDETVVVARSGAAVKALVDVLIGTLDS